MGQLLIIMISFIVYGVGRLLSPWTRPQGFIKQ